MKISDTYLITGANSGLGFHTALSLAKKGGEIILVCKDEAKGNFAKEEIARQSANNSVHLFIADLSSQKQIRKLAAEINAGFSKIDALINNAGCNFLNHTYTEDGIEMQFAVNHLAPFLLTHLLLNKIKNAEQGRIVNISSRAHARGEIHFDNLNLEKKYTAFAAYNQSKLANIFFTYELARRVENTSVTVNCLHPGLVNTPIGNKNTSPVYSLIWSALKMLGAKAEDAIETYVYLATSQEVKNVSGKYFANCKPIESSRITYNKEIALRLWNISEKMTGIN